MKQTHNFKVLIQIKMKLVLITLICFMISCTDDGDVSTNGTLEGRITNTLTGNPVGDVSVAVTGVETRSEIVGDDGLYRFENLIAGTYTIVASHPEFESNSVEISLQPLETAEGDISLIPNASLEVNPTILDFSTAITSLDLSFTNTGINIINYEVQTSANWLSVSKEQGILGAQNTDLLTVTVDRSRLDVGDVQGNLVFNVPGLGSRTVQILASKLSSNAAVLSLASGSLDFGTSLRSRTLEIINEGSSSLLWELNVSESWLSTDQPDGSIPPGNRQNITVFVDRSNLADGDYTGQLNFISNGGIANVAISMIIDSDGVDPSGTVVTSGLRAYYTFDDGTTRDLLNNFTAVNFGATPSNDIPNTSGQSFSFDGIDDFLQLAGNPMRNTNSRTIHGSVSCWVKTSSSGALFSVPLSNNDTENELISGLFNGMIYHSISNRVSAWDWGIFGLVLNDLFFDNSWHHITLTYDGSSLQVSLYIDGVQLSKEAYLIRNALTAETSRIGNDYYTGTQSRGLGHYSGLLDNIRVYNRPLSSSEVAEIFNARQ